MDEQTKKKIEEYLEMMREKAEEIRRCIPIDDQYGWEREQAWGHFWALEGYADAIEDLLVGLETEPKKTYEPICEWCAHTDYCRRS